MKLRKLIACCLLASSSVSAQEIDNDWSIRLTWDPNPASENVTKYLVFWQDQTQDTWLLQNTVPVEAELFQGKHQYVTRIAWIKSTIKIGDELCFNIRAANDEQTSEPSESACATVSDPDAEVSFVISRPGKPIIEISSDPF